MTIEKAAVVSAILAAAVWLDVRTLRINNRLITAGLIAGLVFQVLEYSFYGMFLWAVGCMVPAAILFLLFAVRALGAGDIKLFSVIGGFYGCFMTLRIIALAFFIGAVISMIHMFTLGISKERFLYFIHYLKTSLKERKLSSYYVRERDGRNCVIHFSPAIAAAFVVHVGYSIISG